MILRCRGMSLLELLCVLGVIGLLCFGGMHLGLVYTERSAMYTSQSHIEHAVIYARNECMLRGERLHLAVETGNNTIALVLRTASKMHVLRHWSWPAQSLRLGWQGLNGQNGPDFFPKPYVWNSNGQYRLCNRAGTCRILLLSKLGRIRTITPSKPDDV